MGNRVGNARAVAPVQIVSLELTDMQEFMGWKKPGSLLRRIDNADRKSAGSRV